MNVAELGVEVDTRTVSKGERDLDGFTKSGARAEKQAIAVGAGAKTGAVGVAALAKAAGAFAIASGAGLFGRNAIATARPFNAALAETSTLIEGTAAEMQFLTEASQDFVGQFGGTATQQVQAFYQAISAGAGSVEDAQTLLVSANKLAQGGVTSVATGVDLLTTAVNAYAAEGLTAAEVSDALFVGIKGGKTNAEELGASLGNIVPLASAAGVAFDEVVAGVAALTTQGQTTSVAVTGLRQVIAGVLKPTSEAEKLAGKLGIAFNAQGLKAKGLSGFLADVIDKTGGSQEAMAQLFGSVEALNAVLSIAGGGGIKFAEILGDMESKLGATGIAADKIASSLEGRLVASMGDFNNATLSAGQTLLPIYVAALEAGASGLQLFADNTDIIVAGLGVLTVSALPAAISGLAALTSAATASALAFAASLGPIGLIATGVAALAVAVTRYEKRALKMASATHAIAEAARNSTISLGDEIEQTQLLETALQRGTEISVSAAQVKLQEAKSRHENALAAIAERRAIVQQSESYGTLLSEISSARAAINATGFGFNDTAVSRRAEAFERHQQNLANLLVEQQQFLQQDAESAEQIAATEKNIEKLEKALANAKNGVATIGGPIVPISPTSSSGLSSLSNLASAAKEASRSFEDIFRERTADLEQQGKLIGLQADEVARLRTEYELNGEVQRLVAERGFALSAEERLRTEVQIALLGEKAAALVLEQGKTDELARKKDDLARLEDQRAEASERANFELGRGFGNAITQAGSLEDKLNGVLAQIISIAAESTLLGALTGQTGGGGFLGNVFSGIGAGLFSGGASTGGGFGSAVPQLSFSKGAAFANSVVHRPTLFNSPGGRLSEAGEDGPEGILPLAQAANGDLGVRAVGGGGQQRVLVEVVASDMFDTRVKEAGASQTDAMIRQNNAARDKGFQSRHQAADREIRLDNR